MLDEQMKIIYKNEDTLLFSNQIKN